MLWRISSGRSDRFIVDSFIAFFLSFNSNLSNTYHNTQPQKLTEAIIVDVHAHGNGSSLDEMSFDFGGLCVSCV